MGKHNVWEMHEFAAEVSVHRGFFNIYVFNRACLFQVEKRELGPPVCTVQLRRLWLGREAVAACAGDMARKALRWALGKQEPGGMVITGGPRAARISASSSLEMYTGGRPYT